MINYGFNLTLNFVKRYKIVIFIFALLILIFSSLLFFRSLNSPKNSTFKGGAAFDDLNDEEKEIIIKIKKSTPYKNCDPKPTTGQVEVNFKDDNPFFSEREAKKIVDFFSSPVTIIQTTSFETEEFAFDLKKELPIYDDPSQPIMPILESIFKNVPEIKFFDFIPLKDNPSKSKLIIFFGEKVTPSQAEKLVRNIYPEAIVLSRDGLTPHHKQNPIYFRLQVLQGKERDLVAFLRRSEKVKYTQRVFTSCPKP